MTFGKSWVDILPESAILCIFGSLFTAAAVPLFRWE
jgi:hypothetical protein